MPSPARIAFAFVAVAAVALSTSHVKADAIGPPPASCPKGEVGTSSHAGARCEKEEPKDCPVGWRGIIGGNCMLTPCTPDATCPEGQVCVPHAVCLEPFQDDFYDYNEDEREEHGEVEPSIMPGRLLSTPGLLAGPPPMRKKRPKPITRYNAVNLCSKDVACASPRTCQSEGLCVPRGKRALAYRGVNIQAARVTRKTDVPLTANGVATPDPTPTGTSTGTAPTTPASVTPLPVEDTAPPSAAKSSCSRCAIAHGEESTPWGGLGAGVVFGIAIARRRRR